MSDGVYRGGGGGGRERVEEDSRAEKTAARSFARTLRRTPGVI